ncbi:UNVERIFIED_CONTAM: Mitogen-activated protein kinase kinase kinase [Sesamum latifolium]|uniref:Mitogen-activated protein kinase kinase kinase n=1 Tax=Sesamum latifolium TaxID=2727402 RepID=A0AAW2WQB2_9LAMI
MFMAPEVARGEEQSFPADVWALGCTIIEMSTGTSPWPNEPSTLHRIAFSGETPRIPTFLSDVARDFLSKCLKVDPRDRWTAKQLLGHRFLDEFQSSHVKMIMNRTGSPTSILDQGIWSSIEEEFSQGTNEARHQDFQDCAAQRVKELSMNSGRERWEWGERWITVRGSENISVISIDSRCKREQSVVLSENSSLRDVQRSWYQICFNFYKIPSFFFFFFSLSKILFLGRLGAIINSILRKFG